MFSELNDLQLALLHRALITERNLTDRFNTPSGRAEQLVEIDTMIEAEEAEQEKRYVARITA